MHDLHPLRRLMGARRLLVDLHHHLVVGPVNDSEPVAYSGKRPLLLTLHEAGNTRA